MVSLVLYILCHNNNKKRVLYSCTKVAASKSSVWVVGWISECQCMDTKVMMSVACLLGVFPPLAAVGTLNEENGAGNPAQFTVDLIKSKYLDTAFS